jgi:antitoxin component YwqK of YwqJK toxin-antitoxin module
MKILLSFVFFIVSFISYGQDNPEYREKFYPNGKLMYKGMFQNNRPVGGFERYYETGLLQARMRYSGDYVEAVHYSEVGQLIAKGRYCNNKKDSIWTYYDNKKVISKESYLDNKRNGKSILFYLDGSVQDECEWRNGLKDGLWIKYYINGNKMLEAHYLNSKLNGSFLTFSEKGMKASEGAFLNSLKEGEWKYYDDAGKLVLVVNYTKGQADMDMSEKNIDYLKAKQESEKKFIDPEKYMDDPSEFLMKEKNGRQKR